MAFNTPFKADLKYLSHFNTKTNLKATKLNFMALNAIMSILIFYLYVGKQS